MFLKKAIHVWMPVLVKKIDPTSMFSSSRGLTGSETSCIMYAIQLAKFGHEVTLFGDFTHDAVIDGVSFVSRTSKFNFLNCSPAIAYAWINPEPLLNYDKSVTFRVFNQQVNDFGYCKDWESYVDHVTSPSFTHKTVLSKHTSFSCDKWSVAYNGISESMLSANSQNRIVSDMVFMSSPDRGLHWLLQAFPKIKKIIPDSRLVICYDWDSVFDVVKDSNCEFGHRLRYCNEMMTRLKTKGVIHLKSVSKEKIIETLTKSGVLAYPCDPMSFTEGFSVSTMEACACGCVPVITDADALPEIYSSVCPSVSLPIDVDSFVDVVTSLILDKDKHDSISRECRKLASRFSWQFVVGEFVNVMHSTGVL